MKRMKLMIMAALSVAALSAYSQKKNQSWSEVDLSEEYKLEAKVPGSIVKALEAKPTFICEYRVNQLIEQHASNNKGGGPSVFSEAAFAGVEESRYQQMVNDLYAHLQNELKAAGLTMADGETIINSATAKKHHDGKRDFAQVHPGGATEDRILNGFGNKQAIFRPQEPLYYTNKDIVGTYFMKLASKEDINLITVTYNVTFVGFESDRGYKSKSLSTFPLLGVNVSFVITNPKGAYSMFYYKKAPIYSETDWSQSMQEESNRNGSFWGLSSSADYVITANEAAYIAELSGIIKAMQKDMIDELKINL